MIPNAFGIARYGLKALLPQSNVPQKGYVAEDNYPLSLQGLPY